MRNYGMFRRPSLSDPVAEVHAIDRLINSSPSSSFLQGGGACTNELDVGDICSADS